MSVLVPAAEADTDQRVILRDITWTEFEIILAIRGDRSGVRLAYCEGDLEIMSPSSRHEWLKTTIGRLIEAYADWLELDLIGFGSWTVKREIRERGLEPDECYVLGVEEKERPDLAVEVVLTSGGLDKLRIYSGLEVPEVWIFRHGRITVHLLQENGEYAEAATSGLLPVMDLRRIERALAEPNQAEAVRSFRKELGS